MNYCAICDCEFTDKHIDERHKSSKFDKDYLINYYGNIKKRLYTVEKFVVHFEKYNTKDIYEALRTKTAEEEDPYWLTARQWLTKEDYELLKENVYGQGQRTVKYKYTRPAGFRRFARTPKV